MSLLNFEMREYTRPATEEERAEQLVSLLSTMNTIDAKKSEAKTKAAEYKALISDLDDRETDLRQHLEAGTFIEGVEVHAVVNEMSGNTEYFTKEGFEVVELRHPTSKQEKRDENERKQMKLFGENADEFTKKLADNMQEHFGPDVTVTVGNYTASDVADLGKTNYQSIVDNFESGAKPDINNAQTLLETGSDYVQDYETRRDELAAELGLTETHDENGTTTITVDEDKFVEGMASQMHEQDTLDPAGLDKLSSTMQPDLSTVDADPKQPKAATVQEASNGQPVKKNGKKAVKA